MVRKISRYPMALEKGPYQEIGLKDGITPLGSGVCVTMELIPIRRVSVHGATHNFEPRRGLLYVESRVSSRYVRLTIEEESMVSKILDDRSRHRHISLSCRKTPGCVRVPSITWIARIEDPNIFSGRPKIEFPFCSMVKQVGILGSEEII